MLSIPSDVIDLVAFIANIALVVTLFALVYQIMLERKELKYNRYKELMADFSDLETLLVEHPELQDLYVAGSKPKNWDSYSKDEKAMFFYFDALFGLLERVWVSYKEEKWTKPEDWKQWKKWIEELATNELFVTVFKENEKLYEPSFVKEVQEIIMKVQPQTPSNFSN